MDGVDAAVFRITPLKAELDGSERPMLSFEMLASSLYEFEPALKRKMKSIVASGQASLEELCRLNVALGEEFARAVQELIRANASRFTVDLIGSHGQTIWHAPLAKNFAGVNCAGTMQLGDAAVIAERTRIPVVADFRAQDLAAGGQGAPLVSFADEIIFGDFRKGIGVLNIGGIANITVIDHSGSAVMAFDTGPGNMLADRCSERLKHKDYDEGGKLAFQGTINEGWLAEMLRLPYFDMAPPKTTGRELFGLTFADSLIDHGSKLELNPESIMATVTALTPASIALQYQHFVMDRVKISKLVLGGGGAENNFIIEQLQKRWPHPIEIVRHEDYGISTKFKEALLFALLAYTNYFGISNNVPACTGASRPVCLGKLCRP